MDPIHVARWWARAIALGGVTFLGGCATTAFAPPLETATPAAATAAQVEDDDETQLVAQLRSDLNRYASRETARTPAIATTTAGTRPHDSQFADRARALFAPLSGTALRIPVVGVNPRNLSDSWGDSRDGGVRSHRGIDIFAPKGTSVVAVADGIISYIGDTPKAGHCIWLTTESGASFFYAHLDRWAPGLYEGAEVQSGDLIGFVGNTGNALHTPSHLHFGIDKNDEMVNPYPLLIHAAPTLQAHVRASLSGGSFGTR